MQKKKVFQLSECKFIVKRNELIRLIEKEKQRITNTRCKSVPIHFP